jgi:DNA polymerase (family X)
MSINGNRMPLAQARMLADRISTALTAAGVFHTVCGSLRRGTKPDVGDLDIVVSDLAGAVRVLDGMGAEAHLPQPRKGKNMRQAWAKIDGIKVGLYYGTPQEWGAMILTYTGNHLLNIKMRAIAKRQGLKLNQYGLYLNGEVIAGKDERQVFDALGLPWLEPNQREIEQWTKL